MESSLRELADYRLARAREMLSASEGNENRNIGQKPGCYYKREFILQRKV